jgi:hypothetical protein
MALDHARHQGRAREGYDLGACRSGEVRAGTGNAITLDQHAPPFVHRNAVEHASRAEEEVVSEGR